ncbi:MAG TPA: proline dehydrogenase family protein, partial [Acidimicrobiales bacterium]|nr:proline dehydrogenase family protein [Acidimicrobiales bacterium]
MIDEPDEKRVVALAKQIAELGGRTKAGAYEMSLTTRLMMRFAMRLPQFQTQLFRFVDVFPAMADQDDTARHIAEYFEGPAAPRLVTTAVKATSKMPGGNRIAARVAGREIRKMAGQFIVGTNPAEASRSLATMWRHDTAAVIDLLGEHTLSHSEADVYAARLTDLVETLLTESERWSPSDRLERDDRGQLPRVAVSIKPTALAPDFRPLTGDAGIQTAKDRLRPILAIAAHRGAQVWFDMERYETNELTNRLFRELLEEPGLERLHAGIVVQGYLRDSAEELMSIIDWASSRPVPIAVRLVKGAYWDTETIVAEAADWPAPVYEHKAETDLNYERCIRILHSYHDQVRAAFASHNLRSLAYAIESARAAGIPDNGYEIQLLFGMAEPVHEAVRRLGCRLRVYAPIGELVPGMAYLVRRLLENTSQDSFVRNRFAEGKDLDALLAKPKIPPAVAERSERAGQPPPAAKPGEAAYHPEPLAEWFRPAVRRSMAGAVSAFSAPTGSPPRPGVPASPLFRIGQYVPARIAGKDVSTSRSITSVNPADPA